jgi:hypothetical protein
MRPFLENGAVHPIILNPALAGISVLLSDFDMAIDQTALPSARFQPGLVIHGGIQTQMTTICD